MVEETATLLTESLVLTKRRFEARFGDYPALQRIENVVTTQCRRSEQR
jgi:serine/threonine-protein kinase HipA